MRGVRVKNLIETLLRSEGSLDKGSKVENAQMHPYQGCLAEERKISWNTTKIHPEALARRSNQERLQNKIVITRKCLPEALARGSPQERHRDKIVITRKCISEALARGVSPGKAPEQNRSFQRLWPGVPPGKAPEQD